MFYCFLQDRFFPGDSTEYCVVLLLSLSISAINEDNDVPMSNRSVYHRKGHYTIKISFSSVELALMK